ncbi:MAG: hypothetical protein ABSD59_17200 [Terracidiphilus sp.]
MKRWLRVWILAAAPAIAWGQASTGLPAPSTAGINGVPVPTPTAGYLYYNSGTGSFVFQSPGAVNNCASAYVVAYYAASGTAVSCPAAFTGLGYFSTSAAPTAATGAQIVSALGSTAVNNATSAASFTGNLSGDVTGTQSATTVGKINGGSVPASANLVATNASSQPVAATAHNESAPRMCTTTNSGNAYTCTTSPSFTPAAGDTIAIDFNAANTGSATLAVNGAAAATIKKWGNSSNLAANDVLSGHWISATFDGTYWQLEGQLGNANATQVNGVSVPVSAALLATNSSSQLASVSTLPTTAVPAFTGDMTNTAGSLATTVSKINGGTVPSSANLVATNASGQPLAATAHNESAPRTCATSNSGNAYTCTTSPGFTPTAGDTISINFNAANTASATLAVDGATAATIKKWGNSSNLAANDVLSGHWINATFDGTYWQLEGQLGNANATQVNGVSVPGSASVLGSNSSSQLTAATTTGSGNVVLATSPMLTTPVLGAASATSLTTSASSTLGGSANLFNNAAAATNIVEIQAGSSAVQAEELQWQNYSGTAEWQNMVDTSYTYHIKDAANSLDRMTIYQGGGNTNINAGNGAYAVCLNCAANSGTSGMMVENGASSPTTVLAVTGSGNTTASGFVSGKFFMGNGTMSPTAGAAAGTSPSIVCVTNHMCDGVSGTFALTTGTSPTTGTLATLSFPNTHSNYANCMVATESASAVITTNTWTESTTAITITANTALTASTAYTVKYWCGGN